MLLSDNEKTRSNFGLDYDDTFDRDPWLWRQFVTSAIARGHLVFVTTYRDAFECEDIAANLPGVEIIATGGNPKRKFCEDAGVTIDVWIDDMPELIPSMDDMVQEHASV